MPLYDYGCKNCTKEFELRHSHKETNILCLYCGSPDTSKLLRSSNILSKVVKTNNTETTGARVEEAIEEKKAELNTTKEELKSKAKQDDK
tara:strand:- start:167 stop:436 length:270 start_codon:yes stop_codon:yes gene_type:complete